MLKLIAVGLGLGVCGWTALAQGEVEAQANVILPDGRYSLVVSNHSSKTVTAFAYQFRVSIEGAKPIPEQVRDEFKDSVLYSMEPVIGPGKQAAVPVGLLPAPGQRVLNSPAELRAAVFDDGSAFGDKAWVARIRDRRLVVIETLDAEIAFLKAKIAGGKATRESLAAELENERAARISSDQDPDHQRIMGGQYDALTHNLTSTHDSLDKLQHFVQEQRDRMARAAGVMHPAKLLPPGGGQRQ